MTIVTVAHYRLPADPDAADAVLAALSPIVTATRAEAGNRGIEVIRDQQDPAHLVLVERWADDRAFAAHRTTRHFAEGLLGEVVPRLVSREVTVASVLPV